MNMPNRPSPDSSRPLGSPKPSCDEDTLKTETVQVERKRFIFALKENPRGRFLRITEEVGGRHDSIIIPASGLEDFSRLLHAMAKADGEPPPKAVD